MALEVYDKHHNSMMLDQHNQSTLVTADITRQGSLCIKENLTFELSVVKLASNLARLST